MHDELAELQTRLERLERRGRRTRWGAILFTSLAGVALLMGLDRPKGIIINDQEVILRSKKDVHSEVRITPDGIGISDKNCLMLIMSDHITVYGKDANMTLGAGYLTMSESPEKSKKRGGSIHLATDTEGGSIRIEDPKGKPLWQAP